VWGEPYRKADRSVDVYVGKLRHKLASALPGGHFIHTHFGFGYRFTPFSQEEHSQITDFA
jgi:DNA-binding response OmpR family regulator